MTRGPVVVVGAGPAGMHAALAAADAGLAVSLVDSARTVGGQYHRQLAPELRGAADTSNRHAAAELAGLRHRLTRHPLIEYRLETSVWAVEPGLRLQLQRGPVDAPRQCMSTVDAAALVIATGAHDRVLPFPGWDLPGVVTAGAAQAMAKGQRLAVGRRVLVAGTGPFLLPVAESLLRVGADVLGVLEANAPRRSIRGWASRPAALAKQLGKLPELAGYAAVLARHRVPYRTGRTVVAAHGSQRLGAVTTAHLDADWREIPGSRKEIRVDALCVGHGFTPRLELAVAAGCRLSADQHVEVDAWQATSVPGVFAAGEVTGIGGAALSAAEGRLAGLGVARRLGVLGLELAGVNGMRAVRRGRAFAGALAAAHPIRPGWRDWLRGDTVVCRCEEVPYRALVDAVEHRAVASVRALKLTCRVGLGLCQGRVCGRNATELADALLADAGRAELLDRNASVRRPLAVPIRLGDLAAVPDERDAEAPAPEPKRTGDRPKRAEDRQQ